MALIGLGIGRLSITPAAIGPVKAMIRSLDAGALREAMADMLRRPARTLRPDLAKWADERSVAT
jgi:phosphotransferase system enzyme I (PtsP)